MKYYLLFILLFASRLALSQEVTVRGGFLSDSLRVGEQTAFYLSARYPQDRLILFPDSTTSLLPFEFVKRIYFPTETRNGFSKDSAIYYLTTFEIERYQVLALPAYQVNARDCTIFRSQPDTVRMIEMITQSTDTIPAPALPLKETSAYHEVPMGFNYPVLLVSIAGLMLFAFVVYAGFGKQIRVYFRVKVLEKNHTRFVDSFNSATQKIQSAFSVPATESALIIWKKYMEQLEARPYTRLTTREMMRRYRDEPVGKTLQTIDSVIYGHNTNVVPSLEELKTIAGDRFSKKLQEVKHGAN